MKRLCIFRTPSLGLTILSVLLCSATIFGVNTSAPQQTATNNAAVLQSMSTIPLAFTQNMGQWPDSILYRANTGGATMWFTSTGAYYQFTRRITRANATASTSDVSASMMQPQHKLDSTETMLIKASFVGSNPDAKLAGTEQLAYRCNFFLGNDQSTWRTDVPNYTSVTYTDVYPGIDLKYYGDGRQMEYDFIVPAGADYAQIQIQYTGTKSLTVNANGDLVIETAWGKVTEHAPTVYQVDGGKRTAIASAFRITGENTFGFTLGKEYNREFAVVIDPVLSYSTYLGGSDYDFGRAVAADDLGHSFVTGETRSANFPTQNPLPGTGSSSPASDVFVAKFNPTGKNLLYCTYIGGVNTETGLGIALDGIGNICVTGNTDSPDFPTAAAFDASFDGYFDAFAFKLNPQGNSFVYSTYLGGSGYETGIGIVADLTGNIYIAGSTNSTNFPTLNAYDDTYNGGWNDAIVMKLNPAGALAYSTYLGGSLDDKCTAIALDNLGNACVTGWVLSTDFPTQNAYDADYNGGSLYDGDCFVAKLNPSGESLLYSTYLGGSQADYAYGIATDPTGNMYITGHTSSTDFPTLNAFDASYSGGAYDVFVTAINATGTSLLYSTYIGGSSTDFGYAIALDVQKNAYITGYTGSSNYPTINAFDNSFHGGSSYAYDVVVTVVKPTGSTLLYSTYLGGSSIDNGYGIAVDWKGNTYVAGTTESTDFPMVNSFDASYNGAMYDAFVTRLSGFICVDHTGNVDCDPDDHVDIADLTMLIDNLFISFAPLCNAREANVDGSVDGNVDIGDLTALIDYLFITFTPPALCQME